MALDYLRHDSISGLDSEATTDPAGNPSVKEKLPKGKFSLLLSSSLIVWVIVVVSMMDIKVFSMNRMSVPRIPQKLAVSGIVYNKETPSAIISKKVYSIGDIVNGYTINRITRTEVEFERDGQKLIRQAR